LALALRVGLAVVEAFVFQAIGILYVFPLDLAVLGLAATLPAPEPQSPFGGDEAPLPISVTCSPHGLSARGAMHQVEPMSDEDPMSLPNAVLTLLTEHPDAVLHAGLHAHTMRRTIETLIEAHRRAVASGELAAITAAEAEAVRVSADFMGKLAQAAVRLLEEELRRRPKGQSIDRHGRG